MSLFASDKEFALFLRFIEDAKKEFDFLLHTFCVMPNHFHLLVETLIDRMGDFMGQIEGRYASYFNQSRERMGHVFQGRFKALECGAPDYYRNVVRYISLNPVKAGLATDCGDWPWSGHKQLVFKTPYSLIDRDRILGLLGDSEEQALAAYEAHLRAAGYSDALVALRTFPSIKERSIFAPWAEPELRSTLRDLAARAMIETSANDLNENRRAKKRFCVSAAELGFANVEIATFLGCSESSVSRAISNSASAIPA